jgi:dihydrofolate reductase
MRLSLIVAYAQNRVIGRNNKLPWSLPGDLAHFKRTTLGCPIIMGRKTWESLGRPLPGRRNIVISRNTHYVANGADVVPDLASAQALISDAAEAFVIGGEQIYSEALPYADRIVATEIRTVIDGDARFHDIDPQAWHEASRVPQTPENGLEYDIVEYRRRN